MFEIFLNFAIQTKLLALKKTIIFETCQSHNVNIMPIGIKDSKKPMF